MYVLQPNAIGFVVDLDKLLQECLQNTFPALVCSRWPSSCMLLTSVSTHSHAWLYLAAIYLSHSAICSTMVQGPGAGFRRLLLGGTQLGDLNC